MCHRPHSSPNSTTMKIFKVSSKTTYKSLRDIWLSPIITEEPLITYTFPPTHPTISFAKLSPYPLLVRNGINWKYIYPHNINIFMHPSRNIRLVLVPKSIFTWLTWFWVEFVSILSDVTSSTGCRAERTRNRLTFHGRWMFANIRIFHHVIYRSPFSRSPRISAIDPTRPDADHLHFHYASETHRSANDSIMVQVINANDADPQSGQLEIRS